MNNNAVRLEMGYIVLLLGDKLEEGQVVNPYAAGGGRMEGNVECWRC